MTIAPLRPVDAAGRATTPDAAPRERLAYSVEEAAVLLGISRTSAYLAAQRGEIPSRMIGRRRVVPVVALRAYLEQTNGPDAA